MQYSLWVDERTEDALFYGELVRLTLSESCSDATLSPQSTTRRRRRAGRAVSFAAKTRAAYVQLLRQRTNPSCSLTPVGRTPIQDLVFTAKRTNMSAKFEITRYHGGDEIRTVVSRSGMVRSKHSFKGYDGNQCVLYLLSLASKPPDAFCFRFAWKEQTGGWELLGYKADKAKTKVALGKVCRPPDADCSLASTLTALHRRHDSTRAGPIQ
jgi:hypothetical protein